jgi:hypothetical protein
VRLAAKLGLAEFKPALQFIGKLRNKFAHRLDAAIESQDADNFENSLGVQGKAAVDRAYRETRGKVVNSTWNKPIKQLEPKDRIILYFVTLWAAIAVAAAKSKGGDA